jgi:glycosyltransferase involved in cell wall biosynthesis
MSRRTIAISANASWNLVNFRRPLIMDLVKNGERVVILAPEDEHSARFAELGAEFVPITIDRQGSSPLNDLILLGRYRSALRRIGADLFLGYTIKPNIYGSLAAASLGLPAINNISGLGTAFIKQGLLTRLVTHLYRVALRRSATVFFQNRDDLNLFVEKSMVRPEQTRLLPGSGIDLERFAPQAKPEDGIFRFLLLGRLLWDKGVAEYVEAARRVRSRYPDTIFRMLGFVDVPNRTAVARSEIDNWVAEGLIEYIPACDDVRPHIAAADSIVLPSYREGLPRALLEGGAMAKPLIATDAPGCRDVVEDGANGYLCAVRDAQSLADAMCRMIALDPERRRAMGQQARRLVEERFDQAIVVQSYREAIEDALAASG